MVGDALPPGRQLRPLNQRAVHADALFSKLSSSETNVNFDLSPPPPLLFVILPLLSLISSCEADLSKQSGGVNLVEEDA